MDASISEVREAITLKRDGSRVSLEGVLTGSALGLFLVYLTEDSLEKASQLFDWGESPHPSAAGGPAPVLAPQGSTKPSGPIAVTENTKLIPGDSAPIQPLVGGGISPQGPTLVALGGSNAGSNQIRTAVTSQEPDTSLPPASSAMAGGVADEAAANASSFGDKSAPVLGLESLTQGVRGDRTWDFGLSPLSPVSAPTSFGGEPATVPSPDGRVRVALGTEAPALKAFALPYDSAGSQSQPSPPIDSSSPEIPDAPPAPPPKVLLVQVSSDLGAVAQSPIGEATATNAFRQAAITDSVLDLRSSDIDQLLIRSDRSIVTSAVSSLGSANLNLIAESIGVNGSQLFTGAQTDVVVIDVRDLIDVNVEGQANLVSQLVSRVAGLQDSTVNAGPGLDSFQVQALSGLRFQAVADLEKADLTFDFITSAVNNSSIFTGDSDNLVKISSGFAQVPATTGAPAQVAELQLAFDLQLTDSVPEREPKPDSQNAGSSPPLGRVSISAAAIGLDNSLLDTGAGNDTVVISTILAPSLGSDNPAEILQSLDFDVTLASIGLLRSQVLLGSGDDRLSVGGATVDSLIDLGDGNNLLSLAGPVAGETVVRAGGGVNKINLGDNNNALSLDVAGSALVTGGTKSDVVTLLNNPGSGYVDGGAGSDLLKIANDPAIPLQVSVTGTNASTVGPLQVRNVESLDLGDGNTTVRMGQRGQLDGQLLGGAGIDLLDYSTVSKSVTVDLDAGVATGVLAGISGFEGVRGGSGNDAFAFSASAQIVDGGAGDDLFVLNLNPLISPTDQGVKILGGTGRDLFVFAGLDTSVPPPPSNGFSVLPTFADLRITNSLSGSLGLTDRVARSTTIVGAGGSVTTIVQELTPSGINGLGDAKLLPIAPLDQLLSGSSSLQGSSQLAIAYDPTSAQSASFYEIGSAAGASWSRPLASITSFLPVTGFGGMSGFGSTIT